MKLFKERLRDPPEDALYFLQKLLVKTYPFGSCFFPSSRGKFVRVVIFTILIWNHPTGKWPWMKLKHFSVIKT